MIVFSLFQMGPDGASEEEWGVNYRALSNLFNITQSRGGIYQYEISVQMVEIYNEQVRDLLSTDGQKKYPLHVALLVCLFLLVYLIN